MRKGNPEDYAIFIVHDSRRNDKKRGRNNDLTLEAVRSLFTETPECSYCHSDDIKLTLDRVNNSQGHTLNNVVVACMRCNLLRGNMPYKAWISIVPAIVATLEKGLFGSWMPFNKGSS